MSKIKMYGPQILSTLERKGWSAYMNTGARNKKEARDGLRRGRVTRLEIDEGYVIFPKIEDHTDPVKVMDALERVAVKLNRRLTIHIDGIDWDWSGFRPETDLIKVHNQAGDYLRYSHFLFCLETLADVRGF